MAYEITGAIKRLVDVYLETEKVGIYPKDVPKIKVSEVVSKIAFLYEKIRNIVDFKEEHLLRKDALKRVLKRRLFIGSKGQDMALPMIQELIRGGYLENNSIPEQEVSKIAAIIDKYIHLIANVAPRKRKSEQKRLTKWFIDIAACELEEEIYPALKEQALVEAMYRSINGNFVTKKEKLSEEEKNIQVYIAVLKVQLKADQPMLEYNLLKLYYPSWKTLDLHNIRKIKQEMIRVRMIIRNHIKHPLRRYFMVRMQRYNPLFTIIKDVLEQNGSNVLAVVSNPEELDNEVEKACVERYQQNNKKLKRSIIRSLIYIFLTKMLLALVVEVPLDRVLFGEFVFWPLIINVVFHPIFLSLLVLTARKPNEENTEKIIQGIKEIVYGYEEEGGKIEIKKDPEKRGIAQVVFNTLYAVTFLASFGLIVFVLHRFRFNPVSIIIFLLFLSLVSYFGIKIRYSARELIVTSKKENIISLVIDLMAIPIIRAGRWISLNFSRVNIFVFIMDVIIEAPFKSLIEVFEQWLAFIKEKKEEIFRES